MTRQSAESRDMNSANESSDPVFSKSGIVCIAGMHRSGTSMVARLLNLAGLSLGPDEGLAPPKDDNPDGFWENARFVAVNDELLAAAGGAWDFPPQSIPDGDAVARLSATATSALEQLGDARPVGWKDPRNSLTLNFWRECFPGLRVVICLRNPLEVALSLNNRNFFSYELGLHLWSEYNRRILPPGPSPDIIVTHYDAFFARPVDEIRRVAGFVGLSCSTAHLAAATESVRLDLRHNRFKVEDLLAARVTSDLRELYLSLCEKASWIDSAQGNHFAGIVRERKVSRDVDAPGDRRWFDRARLDELLTRESPAHRAESPSSEPDETSWGTIENRIDDFSKRLEVVDQSSRRLEDQLQNVSDRTDGLLECQRMVQDSVADTAQVFSKIEDFLAESTRLQSQLHARIEFVARQLSVMDTARGDESSASEALQKHLGRLEERDDQIRKASQEIDHLMAHNRWLEADRNGVLKTLEDQKHWYESDLAGLASRIAQLETELQRLSSARIGWLGKFLRRS